MIGREGVPVASADVQSSPTYLSQLWKRFRSRRAAMIGLVALVILIGAAVLAPLLAPYDPERVSGEILAPPSATHWLGTDNVGKDILSVVLYGARVSLIVGFLAASAATLIGAGVGGVAGYVGGKVDAVAMRIAELFQVIPGFLLALVMVALFRGGIELVIVAIAITIWPQTSRLTRAQVLSLRGREFSESARAMGFGHLHILLREIGPNAVAPIVIQMTLDVGRAVLTEAGLSFLGLGDANLQSWGEMLNRAQPFLASAWWMSLFPGLLIFVTVLSFNLIGDGLNDALNPSQTLRRRRR